MPSSRFHPEGMCTDLRKYIDGPSSYLTLPDELKSAIDAITFIAEALQAEKDFEAVSESACFCCDAPQSSSSLTSFEEH